MARVRLRARDPSLQLAPSWISVLLHEPALHTSLVHGLASSHSPSATHNGVPTSTSTKSHVAAKGGAAPREVEMMPTARPLDGFVSQADGMDTGAPSAVTGAVTPRCVTAVARLHGRGGAVDRQDRGQPLRGRATQRIGGAGGYEAADLEQGLNAAAAAVRRCDDLEVIVLIAVADEEAHRLEVRRAWFRGTGRRRGCGR